jgi:hypothetical protein
MQFGQRFCIVFIGPCGSSRGKRWPALARSGSRAAFMRGGGASLKARLALPLDLRYAQFMAERTHRPSRIHVRPYIGQWVALHPQTHEVVAKGRLSEKLDGTPAGRG